MKLINIKYFESSIAKSVFQLNNKFEDCFFCGKTNSPITELDDSLTIFSDENIEEAKIVCLKCLYKKKYGFEQILEVGLLTKKGLFFESREGKDSNTLTLEKQLFSMDRSKLEELIHTLPFRAWQGAKWLVHCDDFMRFIGFGNMKIL